ncbi:phosphoribosylformylglycinamidine synthase subunit PurL [Planctomycetota bacterium]
MTQWRFEIFNKFGSADIHGQQVLDTIRELGIDAVKDVQSARVFLVEADVNQAFARRIGSELLSDPVSETFSLGHCPVPTGQGQATVIEVHLKSGVTDPVAESVVTALADMGTSTEHVRTARKYILFGKVTPAITDVIIKRVLANDCIEDSIVGDAVDPPSPHLKPYEMTLTHWPICDLDDAALMALSQEKDLFLNLKEMQAIRAYFRKQKREPTDIELESLAQTWSEHCVHKTLKSSVDMTFNDENFRFDNLLKETVFKATQDLDKSWCISVFADNAGVVEFDDDSAICFKVETHNHPSALDPYGGAATGIGGVIRDPMGTGMGAKPVANTDVFCFGEPDKQLDEIPKGILHPKRIMKGVVSGVRDYGNRMGIPTVNGAIYFDDRYLGNPLVYCGNVGIMDKDKCFKHAHVGDLVLAVGGRTGRDGIHGATFSSGLMTHEHETIFSHAVQIGNPIVEKKMLDVLLEANEAGLYESITDCGAGGFSSAIGEMGEELGVEVDLDKAPLKYAGLNYTEIWISEAQERMVLAVKPENLEAIQKVFAGENVESTVVGRFTGDKKLRLNYKGQQVAELDMDFLHDGVPLYARQGTWCAPMLTEPKINEQASYNDVLMDLLASYNVASKEWVIRQYDHEVQGGSVVKPLTGITNDGPSDAAVFRPKLNSDRGVAVSCGMNPLYGDIDPYWMALAGIDEAVRNLVCVGARPDRIALLDNFCWGDCNQPEVFGSLVRASQACYDGAMAYEAPFISGKDSLNNAFTCEDGSTMNIPATLLISAMSLVDDTYACVTMDAKQAGNALLIVGQTFNELGGSHYYKLKGELGANVPKLDLQLAPRIARQVAAAIAQGLVRGCHDCSEGGLAVALAEMGFAGGLGIEADLGDLPCSDDCQRVDAQLFSESNSRYVVEVEPDKLEAFIEFMDDLPCARIGAVTATESLVIKGAAGETAVDASLEDLKAAWQRTFAWA